MPPERAPRQKRGPRRRSPQESNNEHTTRADDERKTRSDPELAAAVKCDLTQATTNSYTCQPQTAEHQMTYALRSASRRPEASEPHLTNGFFETRVLVPGRSHQLESSRPPIGWSVTVILSDQIIRSTLSISDVILRLP